VCLCARMRGEGGGGPWWDRIFPVIYNLTVFLSKFFFWPFFHPTPNFLSEMSNPKLIIQ